MIIAILFDITMNLLNPTGSKFVNNYNNLMDCIQSLITASFSTLVLALFIGAYLSLTYSINRLR